MCFVGWDVGGMSSFNQTPAVKLEYELLFWWQHFSWQFCIYLGFVFRKCEVQNYQTKWTSFYALTFQQGSHPILAWDFQKGSPKYQVCAPIEWNTRRPVEQNVHARRWNYMYLPKMHIHKEEHFKPFCFKQILVCQIPKQIAMVTGTSFVSIKFTPC